VAVSIAENHGYDPHLIRATCERIYDITKPSCTKTNVVSHGDLWDNNLMFNNDMPPYCLLVDYQLLRYSPLAHDIAQFLYLCTDRSLKCGKARCCSTITRRYARSCTIMSRLEDPPGQKWSRAWRKMFGRCYYRSGPFPYGSNGRQYRRTNHGRFGVLCRVLFWR